MKKTGMYKKILNVAICIAVLAAVAVTIGGPEPIIDYYQVIHYNGATYSPVKGPEELQLGEKLAQVKVDGKNTSFFDKVFRKDAVSATFVEPGQWLYECGDYDSRFRIYAMEELAGYVCYERAGGEFPEDCGFEDLFTDISRVKEIMVCDNFPQELRVIRGDEEIALLLETFMEDSQMIERNQLPEGLYMDVPESRRLYVTLDDGSQTEILLYDEEFGTWMGAAVRLPKGFMDMVNGE